jgi:glycolate oxidase FAD binding subunit
MAILTPRDEQDLVDIVRRARAAKTTLEVVGRGTRRRLGRPVAAADTVDLSGLTGITLYEPSELVLTARVGTALSEIVATLAGSNQELAFEPVDHSALLGQAAGSGSIGGTIGVGTAGSRRLKIGSARDHLLGFRGVNGFGDAFKSGGRVMKNVTGFDLSKVVCGSFGTLAALTEVTFKVMPAPETTETLVLLDLDDATAGRVMREASGLPQEVDAYAHLPAAVAGPVPGRAATLLRLDGPRVSVAARKATLLARFAAAGEATALEADASRALWAEIREAAPIAARPGPVWRLSLAPSDGPAVVAALTADGLPLDAWIYDWAGGLVWLALAPGAGPQAVRLRAVVDRFGGHAVLVRAGEAERDAEPVFHPQPAALAALAARVKRAFDPDGLLSPGRMTPVVAQEG